MSITSNEEFNILFSKIKNYSVKSGSMQYSWIFLLVENPIGELEDNFGEAFSNDLKLKCFIL